MTEDNQMIVWFNPKLHWSAWLRFHDKWVKRGSEYYLTDRTYFDWAFLHNPYNPTPGQHQFAIVHGPEEIVGYIGRIWAPMLVNGIERRCVWQETSFVRPDLRGQGIGTALYAWATSTDLTGNIQGERQPQVDRVLEKTLGTYGIRECMQRAVLTVDRFAGVPDPHPFLTLHMRFDGLSMQQSEVSWQAAHIWEQVAKRYGMSTARTIQWLRWRFIDHPRADTYRLFVTWAGVAIIRRETAPVCDLVRIVDLWGTEEGVRQTLQLVVEHAVMTKADGVDFLCTGWPDWDAMEEMGFERWRGEQMKQWPMLLNPLDMSLREEQVTLYGTGVHGPLYVTRADDGRDRP